MKIRPIFIATASCLFLAACQQDDTVAALTAPTSGQELPIGFDTYLSNGSTGNTRAEAPTPYTGGLFKAENLQNDGFGIFAYRHEGATLPATATPNFMFNQKVTCVAPASQPLQWTYSPLKYWPNQTTNDSKTGNDATTATADYLSFFAYAPYQSELNSDNGTVGTKVYGITSIIKIDATGAPTITYKVNPDATASEDLLWGTAPMGGINYAAVNGTTITRPYGMPLEGMLKPDTHTRMKFLFQHALTAMTMDIQLAVDRATAGQTGATGENNFGDGKTKVYVNSITLSPKNTGTVETPAYDFGFATEGVLSLGNTEPNMPVWTALDKGSLTIAAEGEATTDVNMAKKLMTSGDGVLAKSPTPVFGSSTNPLMFIPAYSTIADQTLSVTIDYDIVTDDDNYTDGVTVNNVVSKDVTLKSFRAGRLYNLHLVLGLTSVKIDAEAQDWTVDEQTIDLPRNLD